MVDGESRAALDSFFDSRDGGRVALRCDHAGRVHCRYRVQSSGDQYKRLTESKTLGLGLQAPSAV